MSAVSKYRAALEAPTPVGPSKTNVTPLRPDMTATAPAQAAMHYKLAIYNGLKAEQPIRFIEGSARDTLTQLEQVVEVADKKAAHLFSVAVLRDDLQTGESTLAGKAHAGVQAIVLDVDGATAEQDTALVFGHTADHQLRIQIMDRAALRADMARQCLIGRNPEFDRRTAITTVFHGRFDLPERKTPASVTILPRRWSCGCGCTVSTRDSSKPTPILSVAEGSAARVRSK